jgi:hypothetical protein
MDVTTSAKGVCCAACHACRLGWPELLEHPFVRETAAERLKRERALADAVELADSSRAWKVWRAHCVRGSPQWKLRWVVSTQGCYSG